MSARPPTLAAALARLTREIADRYDRTVRAVVLSRLVERFEVLERRVEVIEGKLTRKGAGRP